MYCNYCNASFMVLKYSSPVVHSTVFSYQLKFYWINLVLVKVLSHTDTNANYQGFDYKTTGGDRVLNNKNLSASMRRSLLKF